MQRAGGLAVDRGPRVSHHAIEDEEDAPPNPIGRHFERVLVATLFDWLRCVVLAIVQRAEAQDIPLRRHEEVGPDAGLASRRAEELPGHGGIFIAPGEKLAVGFLREAGIDSEDQNECGSKAAVCSSLKFHDMRRVKQSAAQGRKNSQTPHRRVYGSTTLDEERSQTDVSATTSL